MLAIPKCSNCGKDMERKCFMGGSAPIWRCKACEYKQSATRTPQADKEAE